MGNLLLVDGAAVADEKEYEKCGCRHNAYDTGKHDQGSLLCINFLEKQVFKYYKQQGRKRKSYDHFFIHNSITAVVTARSAKHFAEKKRVGFYRFVLVATYTIHQLASSGPGLLKN